MEKVKSIIMSKTGALIAGVILGTIAGAKVRSLPLLNKLPTIN